MLLGKPEIERRMVAGDIVIEPFVPQNLGSAQYDVTLGEHCYREMTTGYQMPDGSRYYNPFEENAVRRTWAQHQAVSHRELVEERGFLPFKNIGLDDKIILIGPGEMILGHTKEFIGGVRETTTMMKARSSLGRNFIEVCRCAGMGDVGYFNRWTMEVTNTSRYHTIPLVVGRRVAQILFFGVERPDDKDVYDKAGKYQTSSSLEELKARWTPEQMLPKQWNDRECRALRESAVK